MTENPGTSENTSPQEPLTAEEAATAAMTAPDAGGWGAGGWGRPSQGPDNPPYPPYGPGGGWGQPVSGTPIRRHRTRPLVAGALVVGTVAASAGIGHALWPASSTVTASASSPVTGSGSTGSGGTASGAPNGTGPGSLFGGSQYGDSQYGGSQYGGSQYGATDPGQSPSGGSTGSAAGSTEGAGGPSDVAAVAAKVSPALVDVNTTFGYQQASGAGTGIVLTSNGEILTNNHVINGATSISVTDVGNGRTYKANVVGYDAKDDLAVLQLVGASGLRTATIGNSDAVKVGDAVVAVGNAGGAGGTPSASGGSVTALDQSITAGNELNGTSENLTGLIEVNADVQSGDSGGSLVDSGGRVIGVDSAASSGYSLQSASGSSAQGYAIPINKALAIASQIEAGRSSASVHVGPTAFLGVLIASARSGGSQGGSFGYPGGYGSSGTDAASGATVSSVLPGGAAAQAGLAAGDMITSIDGRAVTDATGLSSLIAPDRPGQSISIGWTDSSGQAHTATTTLTAGPPA